MNRELAICQCHCQCYSIASLKCCVTVTLTAVYRNQLKPVNSTGETTKHWKGLMSNNLQWFSRRISSPKSNHKKCQIESNPNLRLLNRIFKLLNHSPKVFKSRFKSQSRLGFAHHWLLVIWYSIVIIAMQIQHSSQFMIARQPRQVGLVVYWFT